MIKKFDGKIICASKYFNTKEMLEIYKLGIKDFGENRVDELLEKQKSLNQYNITWHYIGRLQTNKIKKVINKIDYLHSLDSLKQVKLIQKYRKEPLKCFIQLKFEDKDNKSGIKIDELDEFIQKIKKYDKIIIVGLMTMGIYQDEIATEKIFLTTKKLKDKYKLKYLSMGMTNDYKIAIKYDATHIRLGSYFKDLI